MNYKNDSRQRAYRTGHAVISRPAAAIRIAPKRIINVPVKKARPDADHKGSFTTFFCASEHNGKIHVAHPQNKMVMGSVARELSGVIAVLIIAPVA